MLKILNVFQVPILTSPSHFNNIQISFRSKHSLFFQAHCASQRDIFPLSKLLQTALRSKKKKRIFFLATLVIAQMFAISLVSSSKFPSQGTIHVEDSNIPNSFRTVWSNKAKHSHDLGDKPKIV